MNYPILMPIQTFISELENSIISASEVTSNEVEKPILSKHNFSVKESMAKELRDIGFSKAATCRVLHVGMADVEVMLKEEDQLEK